MTNQKLILIKKNRHFAERTLFGKRPYEMYFSEILKKHFIVIQDFKKPVDPEIGIVLEIILFEDGITYHKSEIQDLLKKPTSSKTVEAFHAAKTVFPGVKMI